MQGSNVELVFFFDASQLFEHYAYVVLISDTKCISKNNDTHYAQL